MDYRSEFQLRIISFRRLYFDNGAQRVEFCFQSYMQLVCLPLELFVTSMQFSFSFKSSSIIRFLANSENLAKFKAGSLKTSKCS